jgi:glutamyl-tRNA reductase
MLSTFKILTVTHKRTNLKEIGDFVIKASNDEALLEQLNSIKAQFGIDELLYLPTCNRVMYFFTTEQLVDEHFMAHFFQRVNPTLSIARINNITEIAQDYQGMEAMEHLFDVAASLDSLVIGERQILRQLREAYEQCQKWGLLGDKIRMAFQQALQGAKTVYANTGIGEKPISVVSLAIQKMLHAQVPKTSRVLLIGAGQTNQLVGKFLLKHHFTNVTVFNRSIEKAQKLAQSFDGEAYTLDALDEYDKGFDVMIVCTGATKAIMTDHLYKKLIGADRTRKVVIDLAIPNNVTPEVVAGNNVEYIEIEGLRNLAKANLAFREQEVVKAKQLLKKYLGEFPRLLKQRQIELAMRSVPSKIKAVKHKAVNEVFQKEIATLDEHTKALMMDMLSYMEKKCIGIPMKAAREAVLNKL